MIYCIVNNYERASFFFQSALTPPGTAVSQIMIESYKKYILVSLLAFGKVPPLSKQMTTLVNRNVLKAYCSPYNQLVTAYEENSFDEIHRVVTKYRTIFVEVDLFFYFFCRFYSILFFRTSTMD